MILKFYWSKDIFIEIDLEIKLVYYAAIYFIKEFLLLICNRLRLKNYSNFSLLKSKLIVSILLLNII